MAGSKQSSSFMSFVMLCAVGIAIAVTSKGMNPLVDQWGNFPGVLAACGLGIMSGAIVLGVGMAFKNFMSKRDAD